jgi:hypothetical protein
VLGVTLGNAVEFYDFLVVQFLRGADRPMSSRTLIEPPAGLLRSPLSVSAS